MQEVTNNNISHTGKIQASDVTAATRKQILARTVGGKRRARRRNKRTVKVEKLHPGKEENKQNETT